MSTRTLAVMFTDIKGFTARTSGDTREELLSLLDRHDKLLRPVFAYFRGTVVKTIGDAFLVWFASPTEAVICGVALQEVLKQHNAGRPESDQLQVRVAVNVGDVEVRGGDLFGEAVNLAARVEGVAEAGEVWFTEAVYLTMNRQEVPTTEIGERTFKGIPHPVRVYKVLPDPHSDQLKRIAAGVKVVGGSPELTGLKPASPPSMAAPAAPPLPSTSTSRPKAERLIPWVIGGAGFLIALVSWPTVVWVRGARADEQAKAKAETLLQARDYGAALEEVDTRLGDGHPNEELRRIGAIALERRVEESTDPMQPGEALDWLQKEVARHPWYREQPPHLPEIETLARMREAEKTGGIPEEVLDRQMALYPKDPEVPWVGAQELLHDHSGGSRDPADLVDLYEKTLALGGHRGDPGILSTCEEEVFDHLEPQARDAAICQRIIRSYYPEDGLGWAKKQLDEGGPYPLLNAMTILEERKDVRATEPFFQELRDALSGVADDRPYQALLAEKDPTRRRRAAALARDLLPRLAYGTPETVVARLKKLASLESG